MKRHWCGLFVLVCVIGAPMLAFGDAPGSFTWPGATGGSVTASTVDFDTWMEKQAEWYYSYDTPYISYDPNGEPDGVAEPTRAGIVSPDWPPAWCRGNSTPCKDWPATLPAADNNGNGIPDIVEFAVIKEICNNPTTYPALHAQVHESFKKNFDYLGSNLGTAGSLVPALKFILAAYALLGDGSYQRFTYSGADYLYGAEGSWGMVAETVYAMNDIFANGWAAGAPDDALCDRLPDLLSACGDADGDGVSNIAEFYGQGGEAGVYSATVRAAYVAAVLNPSITTAGTDPNDVCVEAPPGPGLTWGENLWWNPTNHYVYSVSPNGPWPMGELFATSFTLGGAKVAVTGHLATVDSLWLKDWLVATVMPKIGETVWIGGTDIVTEGDWRWIATNVQFWSGKGTAVSPPGHAMPGMYSNWNGGPADQSATTEPNDASPGEDGCEMGTGGGWNDNKYLTNSNPGLIEFSNGGAGYADDSGNGYPDFWETYVPAPGGPSADFHADVTSGMEPLTVHFTDDSTAPPGETISVWSWNFGDGGTSTLPGPITHIYAKGTWTVALTVTTEVASATKTRTGYITVEERAYRARIGSAGNAWLEEGDLLSLTAVVTGATGDVTYEWKDGDVTVGTSATYERELTGLDIGTHSYTCVVNDESKAEIVAGPYTVTVFAEGSLPVAGIVGLALLAGVAILGARSAFRKK